MIKLLKKLLVGGAVASPSALFAQVSAPSFDTTAAETYATTVKTGVTGFINGSYMETLGAIAIAFLIVSLVMLIIRRARNPR